jgi:ATP-binding cassette subfamily B (MDR/TAP) protein 1
MSESTPQPNAPAGGTETGSLTPPSKASESPLPTPSKAVESGPPPVPFLRLYRFADSLDIAATAVIFFCAAFSGVVVPLTSLVLGELLNGAADAAGYEGRVNRASLYMALLAIGCFLSLGGGTLLSYLASTRQAQRLRTAYVRALLRQDAAWGDVNSLPLAAARLAEDSLSVQAGTGEKLFLVLAGLAQFLGSFGLAFAVASDAWRLALTLLALMPVAVGAVALLFSFVSGLSATTDDAYAAAGAVLVEALALVRTVVALGGEEHEAARYDSHLATAEAAGLRKGLASGAGQGIFVSTMCAFYAVGLYAGARFIALNRLDHPECGVTAAAGYACFSGGTVVQVLFAVVGGVFSLGIVAPNLGYLAGARTAAARLHAVIDRVPAIDALGPDPADPGSRLAAAAAAAAAPQAPPPPPLTQARIAFEGVHFAYPSRPTEPVLRGVSFAVEPGETLALVGPSGAGKSSIVALLMRFYDVDAGRITINGTDIRELPVAWLRRQMALVAQEPQLLPMSVRDNIDATGGLAAVEAAAAAADIHTFVAALPQGYDTLVTSSQVSGGQKQRICLARALARTAAPILLLDEFNSALDSATEARVVALLAAGRTAARASTVMVAHRLSTVRAHAQRIVVLEAGLAVETGTHDALLAAGGLYARLWAMGGGGAEGGSGSSSSSSSSAPSPREAEPQPQPLAAGAAATAASLSTASTAAADPAAITVAVEDAASPEKERGWTAMASVPWRRAWALQAPEALWVWGGSALTVVSGVLLPAFALLITRFVTIFFDPDTEAMVATALTFLGVFLGIGAFMFLVNVAQGYAFGAFGEPFIRRLRGSAFASIVAQGVAFLDAPSRAPPLLAAQLGQDAAKLRLALGARMGEKLASLSTLLVGVALCFWTSWQLTLVVLLIGPFVVLAADAENRVTYGADGEAAKADLAAASGVAGEAAAAMRVVQAFGLEGAVLARFGALLRAQEPLGQRRAWALGLGFGASQFSQVASAAVIFKTGLALLQGGSSGGAPESVFLVFFAFQFACFGLPNLTSLASDLAAIGDSLKAFFSIIATPPSVDGSGAAAGAWAAAAGAAAAAAAEGASKAALAPAPTPAALAVPRGRIELRDVHFAYPSRPGAVLRGASLTIEAGQTAALVGPSGCGKSSIVALLMRLYDVAPGSGSVCVDGVDVRQLPPRALRDAIGWIGQESPLFSGSVGYNIAYGRAGSKPALDGSSSGGVAGEADVVAAARAARAHDFVAGFAQGYDTAVGAGGAALSGGQRQRVVLARALVRKPRILIVDEGTSALDNESEKQVQASIDAVLEEGRAQRQGGGGTTSVIVAHRLSTIQRCDVIFVLQEGRVVEQGTYAELLALGGLFHTLAAAQGLV